MFVIPYVIGFLSSLYGAASKVVSRYITQFDIPASHLGTPRARAMKKVEIEMESETGDEDQPEIEPESQINTQLEGLFVCGIDFLFRDFLRYSEEQEPFIKNPSSGINGVCSFCWMIDFLYLLDQMLMLFSYENRKKFLILFFPVFEAYFTSA